MSATEILTALLRRWKIVLALTVLGIAGAVGGILAATKKYESSAQLFVTSGQASANIADAYEGGLFTQQRVSSYVSLVGNSPVTVPVIQKLHLNLTPSELASEISASNPTNTVLIDITVVDRSAARAQSIAGAVSQQLVRTAETLETPGRGAAAPILLRISQPASFSATPVAPRKSLDLALGLVLGLALGLAAAVARDYQDRSLKSSEELQSAIEKPTFGVIPLDRELNDEVLSRPGTARAEAIRQLRTNLRFLQVDNPPRSIVITSALPFEGKSSTSVNLASVMADIEVRVVLVEADLRVPSLAKYLGLAPGPGLTNVLAGTSSLEEATQIADGRLAVITSGPPPPNPSELLSSARMLEALKTLEGSYDLVLIDAPPVLVATDAVVLGARSGGVLLVARSHRTRRDDIRRAAEILHGVDANVIGGIFNMVESRKHTYYGSYSAGSDQLAAAPQMAPQ